MFTSTPLADLSYTIPSFVILKSHVIGQIYISNPMAYLPRSKI